MITTTNFGALMGAPVLGPDDEKIGAVGQVFVNPMSGRPNWMTVHTGWFGMSQSFVPLDTAEWDHERVHINYGKDFIKDAPRIDTNGVLGQDEEDELYRYYGMSHEEDGDHDSSVGSDDPSGGSHSAHVDTADSHTGTGHVGAHAADVEPDSDADTATDPAEHIASGGQPSRRMRRFVVTEVYVEDDGSEAPVGSDGVERTNSDRPGDR